MGVGVPPKLRVKSSAEIYISYHYPNHHPLKSKNHHNTIARRKFETLYHISRCNKLGLVSP